MQDLAEKADEALRVKDLDAFEKCVDEYNRGNFMQIQITYEEPWYTYEDPAGGTVWVPEGYDLPLEVKDTAEEIRGFGFRTSAPGYLDCTEWSVHPTLLGACEAALEFCFD